MIHVDSPAACHIIIHAVVYEIIILSFCFNYYTFSKKALSKYYDFIITSVTFVFSFFSLHRHKYTHSIITRFASMRPRSLLARLAADTAGGRFLYQPDHGREHLVSMNK